jgi:protein TonB
MRPESREKRDGAEKKTASGGWIGDIIAAVDSGIVPNHFAGGQEMNIRRSFFAAILACATIMLCTVERGFAQVNNQPEAPKIIRKSGGVLQTSATNRVEPAYPPLAKAAGVSGAVVVEVTVDEQGDVISARAISGHPLLKDSAMAAARGWKFTPTQLSGSPVKVIGTITFNFSLDKESSEKTVIDDIEEAKKALNANSYAPEAHFKLAEAYADEDMYKEAIEPY